LLLRFGIAATLNEEKERGSYRLLILGQENLSRFADRIGFISQVKQDALSDALQDYGATPGIEMPGCTDEVPLRGLDIP
uniref:LAGLIDADG family homing endonuclease n=1 Tax=Salmonella sp. SAL4436 TaxID=3159891 RepID=UPI0039793785